MMLQARSPCQIDKQKQIKESKEDIQKKDIISGVGVSLAP